MSVCLADGKKEEKNKIAPHKFCKNWSSPVIINAEASKDNLDNMIIKCGTVSQKYELILKPVRFVLIFLY